MYAQTHYGMYSRCLNPSCKQPFTKDSHRGFQSKSPTEVFVIMECHKCQNAFVLVQLVMFAHDYYKRLPANPTPASDLNEITAAEVRKARRILDGDNALSLLSKKIHTESSQPNRED